jgi:hypothetical protein
MRRILAVALLAIAAPALAQDATAVSSTDFAANAAAFNGQRVAIANCEVMAFTGSDGTHSCVLKTADGLDAKDPGGLPVYIFFDPSDAILAYIAASCTSYCSGQVTITGTAAVDAGTGYVKLTDVALQPM